jgi:hypothetical protein
MANRWALQVNIDVPEPRPNGARIIAAADGSTYDSFFTTVSSYPTGSQQFATYTYSQVYKDPITNVVMLAPLHTTPEFSTTFSGNYARMGAGDITYNATYWQILNNSLAGDIYFQGKWNMASPPAQQDITLNTTAALSANTPMFISMHTPISNSSNHLELLRICYGVYANANRTEFVFMKDGSCYVYRGKDATTGAPICVGFYNEQNDGTPNTTNNKGETKSKDQSNGYLNVTIMPIKDREILVHTNTGLGFSHTCTDLTDGVYNQTILSADKLYVWTPNTGATIQLYKIRYKTSGTFYGSQVKFAYPPPVGATFTSKSYYSAAGIVVGASATGTYDLVNPNFTTFVPNGTNQDVKIRVNLTGDGNGSLAVEATDVYYDATALTTSNSPIDITTALTSLTISTEENGPATIRFTTRRKKIVDLAVPNYNINTDRPIEVKIGSVSIFRGVLEAPKITYEEADLINSASLLEYNGQDRTADFNTMMMYAAVPYDNNTFDTIIKDLGLQCGYAASNFNISTSTFVVPKSPEIAKSKYNFIPEFGDTVGKKIDDLHSTYAITFKKGWFPSSTGYKYNFLDPSTLSTTPKITIYPSITDAAAALVPNALIHNRYYYEFNVKYESPEATAVSVLGVTPGKNQLIISRQRDSAAETPGTAPASRPRNWAGKPIDFIYTDPSITNQTAADQAKNALYSRLTQGRILAELRGPLYVDNVTNVPLWITDVIRVYNPNMSSYSDYRIISIPEIRFDLEKQTEVLDVRSATYNLEKVG